MSKMPFVSLLLATALLILAPGLSPAQDSSGGAGLPADHRDLSAPVTYGQLQAVLEEAAKASHITVTVEGQSVEGRDISLVRLFNPVQREANQKRFLLIGTQHGNEHAGKDALVYLIRDIAAGDRSVAPDIDLYILPNVNPDGTEADQRRNANGTDLNRDHMELAAPETQIIHRVARRIMPHVTVDCHEFTRDSRDYTDRGWKEWPLIMLDTANHPAFSQEIYEGAVAAIERISPRMIGAGHNFQRYFVGGVPGEDELRYSTMDPDDARNGIGALGGYSFIIESGVYRSAADPQADLGERVDAYIDLLGLLMEEPFDRLAVERARTRPLPDYIPTNFFWGQLAGSGAKEVPVVDARSGLTMHIATPNFMEDRIVKHSVPMPMGYAIMPAAADAYAALLDRHGIPYRSLEQAQTLRAEPCTLVRIEEDYDEVYNRYDGRQIVTRGEPQAVEVGAGGLLVKLDRPEMLRAAIILEPMLLHGLFQFDSFRPLVTEGEAVPIVRVMPGPG